MEKVLITGGSRGIGAECVREFSEKGYEVYFTYNNNEDFALSLAEETNAVAIKCDVRSKKETDAVAEITGDVDVLINNAGISQIKMFQDITEDDWDNMFDVNVRGMFLMTQAVVQKMINNKYGRIINISSMWGETGAACEVHYSASKAAVIGFTKSLAKELAPSGITVNCISPGAVMTDMNSHLSKEETDALCDETPVGRLAAPSEISRAALYLADRNAAFITGTVMQINGGMVI